jgi:aminoglycoside phosphotransferase (APT) family kinase protein
LARQALAAAGLPDGGDLQRASSTSNEVFLSGRNIVRVNATEQARLEREAQLCQALPGLRWAPEVIASGVVGNGGYLILRQKDGSPLSRWWPDMRQSQRRDAVEQLAGCLRAIHTTEVPADLAPLDSPPQLLGGGANPTVALLHGIQRLRTMPHVNPGLIDHLRSQVATLAPAIDDYRQERLIHGDLSFENILWDGSQVTAVLDFEWARGAPRDLDLDVLCRFLTLPAAHLPADQLERASAQDYTQVIGWLAESYPELFSHRDLNNRVTLYAIGYEVRATLAHPPDRETDRLTELHPYRRLLDVVDNGGPAALLLASLGQPGPRPG